MRSSWKNFFIDTLLLKKKRQLLINKKNKIKLSKKPITLRSRRSTILLYMDNLPLKIYNGLCYTFLRPNLYKIGHKLGDFVLTKKKCIFRNKKKKKTKKK